MFEFLTPPLLISILILYLLFVWGLSLAVRDYQHSLKERKRLKIFEINQGTFKSLAELLREVEPPFAFEVSVHHLGKDSHFYLIVPSERVSEIKTEFYEAKPVNDYNPYHPGGVQQGFYLKSNKERPILDFRALDFSKVNEIGEGAVVQVVAAHEKSGVGRLNVRIFISAPTPYQAQEILMGLGPSFLDFRVVESKSVEFLRRLNDRSFEEKELITWA